MEEKWIFIKDFTNEEGTIPKFSELYIFRNQIYMNGGLISPSYQQFLMSFITNEKLRKEYIVKTNMIHNKV